MLPIGFAATHLVGFVMWWIVIVRYNFLVVVTDLTSVYSFNVTALAVFLPAGVLQMFLRRMMQSVASPRTSVIYTVGSLEDRVAIVADNLQQFSELQFRGKDFGVSDAH